MDVPKFEVFAMPKFDMPAAPPAAQPQRAKIQCADEVVVPGSRCRRREPGAAGGEWHLAYVCDRNGMQSKVVYSLNTSLVASFAQVNHLSF